MAWLTHGGKLNTAQGREQGSHGAFQRLPSFSRFSGQSLSQQQADFFFH